ncbi:MAG: RagB/SusD family nutrient uptake outer membrane protein [Sphingobacterium sp.]|jgi:hypothetical protein|nr:RagB/SusD family nutrient uptake outer membrane protein [Sphingobacterium sp.]
MKRQFKIFSLLIVCILTMQSCEKWFDVTATDQIKAEDQFASTDGYRDALTGVYLAMGEQSLYGKDMTYNMIDMLAQQYTTFANLALYYNMQRFDYSNVRSEAQIQSMWNKFYFAIANINNAIEHLDKSKLQWSEGEKQIIKGELLGLRAFLHFDLMRVFGHSDYANRSSLADVMAIPYSRTYSKDYVPQETYLKTFELMEKDINEALSLLVYDPIKKNTSLSNSAFADINRDGFYSKRNNRMNYYAVKALQARVLAWQGTGDKLRQAAESAEEVIADSNLQLLRDNVNLSINKTILSEHVFGLKVTKLASIVNPLLEGSSNTEYNALRIPVSLAEDVYEASDPSIGPSDVRFNTLLSSETMGMISVKLRQLNGNHTDYNTIPLMKLPEMYYIAAEYYSKNNLTKAISLVQAVRASRRIAEPLPMSLTLEDFEKELQKEYRKEYVSEGQLFFYYKRKGVTPLPNYSTAVTADDKIYMLPFPKSEIEFGNRVQAW